MGKMLTRTALIFNLTLQRHFGELTTDCTNCTDTMMLDSGPSVSIREHP